MARRRKTMTSMNEETQDQNEMQQEDLQNEAPEVETPTEEGEDFEAKYNEMNDRFLRLYSEFENFRRRTAKERIDLLTNSK